MKKEYPNIRCWNLSQIASKSLISGREVCLHMCVLIPPKRNWVSKKAGKTSKKRDDQSFGIWYMPLLETLLTCDSISTKICEFGVKIPRSRCILSRRSALIQNILPAMPRYRWIHWCIQFSSNSQITSHEIIPMQLDSYSPLLRFLIWQVLQQSHLNLHRLKLRRVSKVKSPPSRSTCFPKLFFGWRMFCLYIICHPQSRKTEKAHYYRSVESGSWVIA